ncbi:MAG: hypothetical protein K8T20_11735 [Planctomycetes bacterium]|nr:hypothetical protein [Planctomycetota bacterium]
MKSLFLTLPLALFIALPVLAQDSKKEDPKKTEQPKKAAPKDDPAVKKAIGESMKKLEAKSYNFKAKLDLEMGGNPMLNTEMKGAHKKPYTKMAMEMMGQAIEIYTDGKTTVQKNPQTGAWEKTDNSMTGTFDPKQLEKMIKTAEWDAKDTKVGSHVCKVAKARVDKAKVAKMIAKNGMGGQAKISKSSLKFYIDKKDGKVRRMKLTMTMSVDMGGGQGGGMEMQITMDQRLTYTSKVDVKIPAEVKKMLEGKTESPDGDHKGDPKKGGGDDEDEDEDGGK